MMKRDVRLELIDVTKTFMQGDETITALKHVTMAIKAGEFVAVVGPSGSGKSTFLTIAGALQRATDGTVKIDGKETSGMSLKQLSKLRLHNIGFILQASNLVPYLTVKHQLKLVDIVGKRRANHALMDEIFRELSIQKLIDKYPSDLSGGERQRVAIAKVLYGDSTLILADEPTASLDTERAFDVVKLLAKETHSRGKATIMVTHDTRLIKYCDRAFTMKDGVLTEDKKRQ